jgi:hypothetical protein
MGKPEGKRTLGRPRHTWEAVIRMDLMEIGWGKWIKLAQDRDRWWALVNAVMNFQVLVPWSYSTGLHPVNMRLKLGALEELTELLCDH